MKVIRGAFVQAHGVVHRPRPRGGRCVGPGLPGRRPGGTRARDQLGPRRAAIVVGTSAGSVTGAALRVGVPATDLAASLYGVPTSRRGGAILERILPADAGPLPTPSVRTLLRPWNLPSPRC